MSYIPKPKPCFLDGLQKFRVIGDRQIYRANDKYYSWDELHGEIEVFTSIVIQDSIPAILDKCKS